MLATAPPRARPPDPPDAAAGAPRVTLSIAAAATALALLLGLQPVTTDLYLPALPHLTRELGATVNGGQLTMAALILAFGVGQLFWGPVADRVGRRPVLLVGLALYTVAGVACALATDITALIALRMVQGACLASAIVGARAMLRDLYEPAQGAQVMSLAMSGLGLMALASPALGGLLAAAAGWRAALGLVAGVGAVVWLYVAWRVPETSAHRNPLATRFAPLLRQWWEIGRNPTFASWALLVTCSYAGLFVGLSATPFVYAEVLGLAPAQIGLALAVQSLSYVAGTFLCRRWVARHGLVGAVQRAALLSAAAGGAIIGLAWAGVSTVWALLVPQCLFVFAHGVHQPVGQAALVGPFPRQAGAAAALAGFVLAVAAFGIGLALGQTLGQRSVWPLAAGIGLCALATALMAAWWVPRVARAGAGPLPATA